MEHPMDCFDMVIGMMIDGMSQVRDYYSVSHIMPQPDEFFGGKDSLASATAYQQDGVTTIVFRKPLKGESYQDNMCVINFSYQSSKFCFSLSIRSNRSNNITGRYYCNLGKRYNVWKIHFSGEKLPF